MRSEAYMMKTSTPPASALNMKTSTHSQHTFSKNGPKKKLLTLVCSQNIGDFLQSDLRLSFWYSSASCTGRGTGFWPHAQMPVTKWISFVQFMFPKVYISKMQDKKKKKIGIWKRTKQFSTFGFKLCIKFEYLQTFPWTIHFTDGTRTSGNVSHIHNSQLAQVTTIIMKHSMWSSINTNLLSIWIRFVSMITFHFLPLLLWLLLVFFDSFRPMFSRLHHLN